MVASLRPVALCHGGIHKITLMTRGLRRRSSFSALLLIRLSERLAEKVGLLSSASLVKRLLSNHNRQSMATQLKHPRTP